MTHSINQVPSRRLYLHFCYVSVCIAGLQKRPIENHHKAHVRRLIATHHDPHPVVTLHCTISMHAHYWYHNLAKISDWDKGESPAPPPPPPWGAVSYLCPQPCQLAAAHVVASRGTSGTICGLLLPWAAVGLWAPSIPSPTRLLAPCPAASQRSLPPSLPPCLLLLLPKPTKGDRQLHHHTRAGLWD